MNPGGGATVGGAVDTTGVGLLTGGTFTADTVGASKSTDDVFEATVSGLGCGIGWGGGNWVDNGVLPGCKILDGVTPEGLKDLDCLPALGFGFHLALALPPLVLDDEELKVSIATKINSSNSSKSSF